jgi:hypothetical protein
VLYFTASSRDGGTSGTVSCTACCCENFKMRPGETNLLTINYAPWSVPIGWLTPTLEYTVDVTSTCSTAPVDGLSPPTNQNQTLTTAMNTALAVDTVALAGPSGNVWTVKTVPLAGPKNGILTYAGLIATYTPNAGFTGYDYFWYELTDTAGRKIIRSVIIEVTAVGINNGSAPKEWSALGPYLGVSKVVINESLHTISFPIYMSHACSACESYKLTIKQPARDCNGNIYEHFMCFEIRCGGC